jgi:hypothetical protein
MGVACSLPLLQLIRLKKLEKSVGSNLADAGTKFYSIIALSRVQLLVCILNRVTLLPF